MSRLRKWNTTLYILNILVCLVILFDTYFAGTYNEVQKCTKKEVIVNRSRSHWHDNYQITSTTGIVYSVSERAYFAIAELDTFIVHRTSLLGKANAIIYNKDNESYKLQMGPIFNRGFGLVFNLAPLLTCLVLLFYTLHLKRAIEIRHALMLTVISLLVVYTYFVSQS